MGGYLARDGANAQLGLPERPDLTLARPCPRPASPALQIPIPPREQAGITHLVEARIPKPNYLGRFMQPIEFRPSGQVGSETAPNIPSESGPRRCGLSSP
jgi:hypothetical protein